MSNSTPTSSNERSLFQTSKTSKIWEEIKNKIILKNSDNKALHSWFDCTQLLDLDESQSMSCFKLGVPTDLHKYWISRYLLESISSEISDLYKRPFQVDIIVTNEDISKKESEDVASRIPQQLELSPTTPYVSSNNAGHQNAGRTAYLKNSSSFQHTYQQKDILNRDYTFSSFVVGKNNEFAHAASFSVAENPGHENYNPLFICGPTGMGKTHLLNAVGNHVRDNSPHLRICYCSAEKFVNEFISSIRRREMHKFRKKYRESCDILLMDDIQMLGKGEALQEEFFHTLNDFFEKGQQVVVASDRMPREIPKLEDRIRTRLEWGLIADIQMPDLETRIAILKYKAEQRGLFIPQDVISYIARISKRSIRELEGNLNKIKMYSELQNIKINLELAKQILATHAEGTTISAEQIQKLSAEHFNVRVQDLKGRSRTKPLVTARQVAMYLIKKYTNLSLVDIGKSFGGKDHSTVINALRKIESQQSTNSILKKDIEDIEQRIHNITGV